MCDGFGGRGPTAVAGVGSSNRIIASSRAGSVSVATGTINPAITSASGTGATGSAYTNVTDAIADAGAQVDCPLRPD